MLLALLSAQSGKTVLCPGLVGLFCSAASFQRERCQLLLSLIQNFLLPWKHETFWEKKFKFFSQSCILFISCSK